MKTWQKRTYQYQIWTLNTTTWHQLNILKSTHSNRHTQPLILTTTDSISTLCAGCGCTTSPLRGSSKWTTIIRLASVTLLWASSSTCNGPLSSPTPRFRSNTTYWLGSVTLTPDPELGPGWQSVGLDENSDGHSVWKVTLRLLPRQDAFVM